MAVGGDAQGAWSAFRSNPPTMAALAPMATPVQRLLTAWVSPASAAPGKDHSKMALTKAIVRVFRIEVLLPEVAVILLSVSGLPFYSVSTHSLIR